ncbi:MAG: PAS-domain containing protein [Candidatus Devosia euplotis]|nr:PAS-domain containing protein [Candidatus Devosia euplotis]
MSPAHTDTTSSLSQAIDHISQGIAVFDARMRLVTSNARYNVLLELPDALQKTGTPLFDIALFLGDRGDLGDGDAARLGIERINLLTSSPMTIMQRPAKDGQTLEFHSSRLPDGRLVIALADVTVRVKAERALEQVNLSLEARVAERTAALTRVNTEMESARQGRCGQSRQDAFSGGRQP